MTIFMMVTMEDSTKVRSFKAFNKVLSPFLSINFPLIFLRNDRRIFLCHYLASSLERRVAFSTAFIRVARRLPFSSAWSPAMVVPPGEVTRFFNSPGVVPVSLTSRAEPRTVWIVKSVGCRARCVRSGFRDLPAAARSAGWGGYLRGSGKQGAPGRA